MGGPQGGLTPSTLLIFVINESYSGFKESRHTRIRTHYGRCIVKLKCGVISGNVVIILCPIPV